MESENVSDIWVKPTRQKCHQIFKKHKNIDKYFDVSFKSDSRNRDKVIKLVKYWWNQNVLIRIL